MKRIFISKITQSAVLDKENQHYLKNVLRLKNATQILVFDGMQEALMELQENTLKLIKITRIAEKTTPIRLAVAQIQATRLEWLVEKATEIGVDEIFLLETERTQKSIKQERLKKIALEAAKQSQRITIPIIHTTITLKEFIKKTDKNWHFGHIDNHAPKIISHNSIIIGPEGGWTSDELNILTKNFIPIYLNKNVLKAETAALVGLITINNNI